MERKHFATSPCSIARSLDILGDWWTPLILRECLYGMSRFDEFHEWLGIGRNVLTKRLGLLVEHGLLERRRYQVRPTRYAYHLTDKGYDAASVLLAMMRFGERWYFDAGQPPIELYRRRDGARVRPCLVDEVSGEPLDMRELYAGPGPGFPFGESAKRHRFTEFYARQKARDEGASAPQAEPDADCESS